MINYSVIIPTHNRSKLLSRCLDSLALQTIKHEEFEVIIVDDGSTDNTESIVKFFIVNFENIKTTYIKQNRHGPSHARNVGIDNSNGKYIFFTDDDCILPRNWMESLINGYEKYPNAIGVGGLYNFAQENNTFFVKYHKFLQLRSFGNAINSSFCNCSFLSNPAGITANMSYKKSFLSECGGFDESFRMPGFEDLDLKKRACEKFEIAYIPIVVTQIKKTSLIDSIRRFFYFGENRFIFLKKHSDLYSKLEPTLEKSLTKFFETQSLEIKTMISLDYIFTNLGWEYQKIKEKFI